MSIEAMSIDEVMRVANDFGFSPLLRHVIEQHVAEAVEREREACAKACEDVATTQWDEYAASYNSAVFDCAAAIRARGTT